VDGVSNFFVQNCTCGRFHTVTFETVSLFISYIYLRIPSYLGLRGEPFIFSDLDFFAVPSNAFIRIHISHWFCSMGHSWSNSLCDRHTQKCDIGPGLKTQPGIQFFFTNFGTNSYKRIHTIVIQIVLQICTRCGFCTNSYNFYTNSIVRIHTRCDFFILFLSLRKPQANDNDRINYLAIRKGSSRCFIRIRISNSYKTVWSAKTSKSEKVGLLPLPRYVKTCKIMYEKIRDTIHKSGLYSLTRVAYSQPL
jgi:hypothetical protein